MDTSQPQPAVQPCQTKCSNAVCEAYNRPLARLLGCIQIGIGVLSVGLAIGGGILTGQGSHFPVWWPPMWITSGALAISSSYRANRRSISAAMAFYNISAAGAIHPTVFACLYLSNHYDVDDYGVYAISGALLVLCVQELIVAVGGAVMCGRALPEHSRNVGPTSERYKPVQATRTASKDGRRQMAGRLLAYHMTADFYPIACAQSCSSFLSITTETRE